MEEANHADTTGIFELELEEHNKENVAPSSDPTYQPSDDDDSDISEDSDSDQDSQSEPTSDELWEQFQEDFPFEAKLMLQMPWMGLDNLDNIYDFAQEMAAIGWNVFGWIQDKKPKQ